MFIQVTANSPSHNKLFPGDAVVAIDGKDTSAMKHEDAKNVIRNSLRLQFVLRRYVS
jgi:PDZ domain-containing secreted protein